MTRLVANDGRRREFRGRHCCGRRAVGSNERIRDGEYETGIPEQRVDETVDAIEEVDTGVQDIDSATDRQATTTGELTEPGEATAQRAESAAAATQEQTDATTRMTEMIRSLADDAKELQAALDDLTVSRRDRAAPP